MRAKSFGLLTIILSVCSACAQTISVGNAGLSAAEVVQVAPGSLVSIFWYPPDAVGTPNLSAVSLGFRPRGTNQISSAQIVGPGFSSNQLLAVVPAALPMGVADVLLVLNSVAFQAAQVTVVPAAINVFTTFGYGPATAQNISNDTAPQLNQLTHPALPGQYVTLWGTGLGSFAAQDVIITLAGQSIQPSFAGHAPGIPGLDQINFPVPAGAMTGCYVPLSVSVGGSTSRPVTLSLAASPGVCVHPLGLTAAELLTLDQGGSIFAGTMTYFGSILAPSLSSPTSYTRSEGLDALFWNRSAAEIFAMSPQIHVNSGSASTCGPPAIDGGVGSTLVGDTNVAGSFLTLTGPSGQMVEIPAQPIGYELSLPQPPTVAAAAELPPPFLTPGAWNVSVPGGDTIGAFGQAYQLPPQVRWTNRESLTTFGRTADLSITWNPQGYTAQDVLNVLLSESSTSLSCSVAAQAGSIVVPASLLQQFAAGSGTLQLVIGPQTPTVFDVPLVAGGSAPVATSYYFSDRLSVTIP